MLGRESLIGAAAALLLVVSPVAGQLGRHDHTGFIDRNLPANADLTRLMRDRGGSAPTLAIHFLDRGQLLLDLYEFQRILTRDYALQRDSIGRSGGVQTAGVHYLLGRAFQELGDLQNAARAYRTARTGPLPDSLRASLDGWEEALRGGGDGWRTQLEGWRRGKAVSGAVRCSDEEATTCRLFQAIVANDVDELRKQQVGLLARPVPVYTFTTRELRVEFHDPLPLFLLATADFLIGARIAELAKVDLVRGVALLRGGRAAEAEPLLRLVAGKGDPDGAVATAYLGEAYKRLGRDSDADAQWRRVAEPGSLAGMHLLDAQSGLGLGKDAAFDQMKALRSRNLRGVSLYNGGHLRLARVLIRHGVTDDAGDLLQAGRPAAQQSDFDGVSPQVLVLSARARYEAGRSAQARRAADENVGLLFRLAREDLAAPLADGYPVAVPLLEMLQEVTGLRVPAQHAR